MDKQTLIKAITEQLNGDQDVLAKGWEDSTIEVLLELYSNLDVDVA